MKTGRWLLTPDLSYLKTESQDSQYGFRTQPVIIKLESRLCPDEFNGHEAFHPHGCGTRGAGMDVIRADLWCSLPHP